MYIGNTAQCVQLNGCMRHMSHMNVSVVSITQVYYNW